MARYWRNENQMIMCPDLKPIDLLIINLTNLKWRWLHCSFLRDQKMTWMVSFKKFLNIFNSHHINIPFVVTLQQMPRYVKFMKPILMKERKVDDHEVMDVTEIFNVVLQRKLPPRWLTITYSIYNIPCLVYS